MDRKTAVVTGVSSGIGQAIAHVLLRNSWRVIGISRTPGEEPAVEHVALDLADLRATAKVGEQIASALGKIDAFIHVAGIWHDENTVLAGKKLEEFSTEQIMDTMDVGATSCLVLCSKLLPVIKTGAIIGISGTFAEGGAGWLPYYTSKRALEDFLHGLARDYTNLKVYGISPSDTATPAYARFYSQFLSSAQPPEAVAHLAIELLEGGASYKSGDIIQVRKGIASHGYHV
jgi:3-oxoacyl-[acyl-carrier protein] reductase